MTDSERQSHGPAEGPGQGSTWRQQNVRYINDLFRITGLGGRQVFTQGVRELGLLAMTEIRMRVAEYKSFTPDSDPSGEHNFGAFEFLGHTIFWTIDTYDKALTGPSQDPTKPSLTTRVLTIMLAREYQG